MSSFSTRPVCVRFEKDDLCESAGELRVADRTLSSCCAGDGIDSSSFTMKLEVEVGELLNVGESMFV